MKKKYLLLAPLTLLPAFAFAQEEPPIESPAPTPEMVAPETPPAPAAESPMTIEESMQETFAIDFADEDVRAVIRNVADLLELNISIPQNLRGTSSVRLRNVTWPQVFDIVLSPLGFTYEIDGNIIRIIEDVDAPVVGVDSRVTVNDDGLLTVNFEEPTPIREIISIVADTVELNLAPLPRSLQGSTQFRLRGVTWQQIFDNTLSVAETEEGVSTPHTFEERDGVVVIVVQDAVPVRTEIFQIRYPAAASIAPFVTNLGGINSVQNDPRTNVLIVTGQETRMREVRNLISRLDQPIQQVLIESRFIEIRKDDEKEIGIDWQGLRDLELSATSLNHGWNRETGRDFSRNTENQFINDSGSTFNQSTTGAVDNLGNVTQSGTFGSGATGARSSNLQTTEINNFFNNTSRVTEGIFSASDIRLIINLLKTQTDAKVISNPTITVVNGATAQIRTEDFLFREGTRTETETTAGFRTTFGEARELENRPEISLEVSPQISAGDLITLNVKPTVNNQIGTQNFASGEVIPVIRTRTAETQVTIRDGQTLAIGGLVSSDERNSETKVPFFGDIPGLGRLFRSEGRSVNESNIIIFLTASIVDPHNANYTDFIDEARMAELGLSHRDAQGFAYRRSEQEAEMVQEFGRLRSQERSLSEQQALQRQIDAFQQLMEAQPAEDDLSGPRNPAGRRR